MAWIEEKNDTASPPSVSCWRKAWHTLKENPVISLAIAALLYCLKEVLSVALHPLFSSMGIALQNTSLNAWQKWSSMKYISAASYNLTDFFVGPALLVTFAFLTWLWHSQIQTAKVHRDLKNDLAANLMRENRLNRLASATTPRDSQKELYQLRDENAKERQKLEKDLRVVRILKRVGGILAVTCTVLLISSVSFSLSVYKFTSQFHRECDLLRPYMSDDDYHRLIRQWTMMTSRADYLAIEKQLAKIRDRIELYDNVELVNEIFRAKAAAEEAGKRKKQ